MRRAAAQFCRGLRPQRPLGGRQAQWTAHQGRPAGSGARPRGAWRLHADQRAATASRPGAPTDDGNDTLRPCLAEGRVLAYRGRGRAGSRRAAASQSSTFGATSPPSRSRPNRWRCAMRRACGPKISSSSRSTMPTASARTTSPSMPRGHRWYFYPGAHPRRGAADQAMGLGWPAGPLQGSRRCRRGIGVPCTFSFHSAFEDPATLPDAAGPLEHRGAVRGPV